MDEINKDRGFLKLKTNNFEYIRVTGQPSQFNLLKRFCGDEVTITYESCHIDDYWCIRIDDCLKERKVIVPNYDFILKLPEGFTVVSSENIYEYFSPVLEVPKEQYNDINPDNVEGD